MLKKSVLAIAFGTIVFAAPLAQAASAKESLAAFHAALAAGDKARALDLMAPEAVIYEAGHVERSRADYASHHLGDDMEFAKGATRTVLRQTERSAGNLTVIWEETETKGTFRGKDVHVFGAETAILENSGDAWRIVHVHWSSRKGK